MMLCWQKMDRMLLKEYFWIREVICQRIPLMRARRLKTSRDRNQHRGNKDKRAETS